MSVCGYEHVRATACRDQKIRQIPWSWSYMVVSIPTCKLGAEYGSSAGAAGAVNC